MRNTMADPTLANIVERYGAGQAISLQEMTRDFGVDDFKIYEVMAAPHGHFSSDWTPRVVNDDAWTITSTRDIMTEALAAAANGNWTTWQILEKIPMEHPCEIYLGTAIVMAAQPEGFRATDGAVYRASAEPPNRIKVWKE
jgi:hypothetical protein